VSRTCTRASKRASPIAAYDRPSGGPRAFLVGGAELRPDRSDRLLRLARPGFPVHETVILEQDPGFPLPELGPMLPLELSDDRSGRLALEVDAPFDGVVVVSESWHSGWEAWVDGEQVELTPVDHALLGVPVRAGSHRVEFAFRLPQLQRSRYVQGFGLLLFLGAWVADRRRRPEPPAPVDAPAQPV
jgi:hypothetical protein